MMVVQTISAAEVNHELSIKCREFMQMNKQLEYALDASQKQIDKLTDMLSRTLKTAEERLSMQNFPTGLEPFDKDIKDWWEANK